ncbi:signal recognition particle subunit SRP72-like [Canna indica]|uniref:Signal recognition particle subunit SRP72 n=1 Tax=Canna indica TaxID=4628 RepID=A0AAQ3KHP8_9LILI|nr:signal recognition particle subunit SRP72-like [Canna indica]
MAPKTKVNPKPSPAAPPPAAQAVPVEDLFSLLHRHAQNFEYEQAAKVADQVLAVVPGDEDALRCKIVALIKSDAIDKALSAIEVSRHLPVDLRFYEAYCLYRQNKLHEALDLLDGEEKSSMLVQLESQILYRLGKMDACMDSYEKIQRFKIDSLDLKANIIAALVAAGRSVDVQGTMDALKVKASSSFEIAYNYACSLIEKQKYLEAEQQLLSARRIGQEMLMEEDYADDEIETELAPIAVQLAYVKQLQGHTQEAIEAYTAIINRNLSDYSSLAVATNNLIALRGTKDVSDSLRRLDRLIEKGTGVKKFQLANGLDFKLSTRQKESLYSNRLLLLLQANRMDQAQEIVAALPEMFPDSVTPVLLQAALLVREKKVAKAEEILIQYADRFPDKSKLVLLARAQIAAAAGHFQISVESLAKIPDIQNMPATVATLVSLRERMGDLNGATAVLDTAIEWWKNSMTEDNKLDLMIQEAATFKFNHGREEEASQLYEKLVKSHGNVEALIGLVMTAARTDLKKAELYEKQLRQLSGLKRLNAENLEKTSGAKHVEGPQTVKAEVSEDVKKAKTKKRKRKPRYPKGFDPANPGPPPDPERWLPKRERSSYRPKRKDKRSQIRGSQGAVVREKHDATIPTTTASAVNGSTPKSGQVSSSSSKGVTSSTPPKIPASLHPSRTSHQPGKERLRVATGELGPGFIPLNPHFPPLLARLGELERLLVNGDAAARWILTRKRSVFLAAHISSHFESMRQLVHGRVPKEKERLRASAMHSMHALSEYCRKGNGYSCIAPDAFSQQLAQACIGVLDRGREGGRQLRLREGGQSTIGASLYLHIYCMLIY